MAEEPLFCRAEKIRKRYGEIEVLKGISFELYKGDIKVVIGPSGSGKSTLLHCTNFLVKFDEGRIWLNETEVNHARKSELYAYRQKVGMIFQDFNLFDHLSALQNVQIGLVRVKKLPKNQARARPCMSWSVSVWGNTSLNIRQSFQEGKNNAFHCQGIGDGP